jgi:hypothetical protein
MLAEGLGMCAALASFSCAQHGASLDLILDEAAQLPALASFVLQQPQAPLRAVWCAMRFLANVAADVSRGVSCVVDARAAEPAIHLCAADDVREPLLRLGLELAKNIATSVDPKHRAHLVSTGAKALLQRVAANRDTSPSSIGALARDALWGLSFGGSQGRKVEHAQMLDKDSTYVQCGVSSCGSLRSKAHHNDHGMRFDDTYMAPDAREEALHDTLMKTSQPPASSPEMWRELLKRKQLFGMIPHRHKHRVGDLDRMPHEERKEQRELPVHSPAQTFSVQQRPELRATRPQEQKRAEHAITPSTAATSDRMAAQARRHVEKERNARCLVRRIEDSALRPGSALGLYTDPVFHSCASRPDTATTSLSEKDVRTMKKCAKEKV